MPFDHKVYTDEGRLQIWSLANICGAILALLPEGVPKLKAKATLSELIMLSDDIPVEHPAWLYLSRSDTHFEEYVQSLSICIDAGIDQLRIISRAVLRQMDYNDNTWEDTVLEEDATFRDGAWDDQSAANRAVLRTSMLLHLGDKIMIAVPDEQKWF